MRYKSFATIVAVFVLSGAASAQTYSIRVDFNTNLRAEPSLDSQVVESAPAGSILQVVDSFNRWLKISRNGREVWMASWVSHSRVAEGGQTASQPASNVPAQVDNCCFVDRQCHTAAGASLPIPPKIHSTIAATCTITLVITTMTGGVALGNSRITSAFTRRLSGHAP